MSSNQGTDDTLKIPIEIKTEELDEIRELINDIAKAESDVRELKPLRGKGQDTTSRSAFAIPEVDTSGIFGEREGPALPAAIRDKTSKQAFTRENQFAKLREQVQENTTQVEQQQTVLDGISGGLGQVTGAVDYASTLSRFTGSDALKSIGSLSGKLVMPVAIITTIIGLINQGIQLLLAPGGPWDRRFKRRINDEIASATDRELKAQISQNLKIIRMSSYGGFKGQAGSAFNEATAKGTPIYDMNMEIRSKGL